MAKAKVKEEDAEDEKEDKKAKGKKEADEEGAEGESEGEEGGGKKSKKKLIIIAAAAVLLLAGAGAGLYFSGILGGGAKETAKEEGAEEGAAGEEAAAEEGGSGEEAAAEEGGHGEGAKEGEGEGKEKKSQAGVRKAPGGGVYYDRVPQFRVNLNTGGRQARYLIMTVGLELENAKDVSTVDINMPRINDNFQTYLRDLRTSDLEGSVGLYRLKEELMVRINNIIAPAKVKDILFKEFIIQ